jgi:hypothetical protein
MTTLCFALTSLREETLHAMALLSSFLYLHAFSTSFNQLYCDPGTTIRNILPLYCLQPKKGHQISSLTRKKNSELQIAKGQSSNMAGYQAQLLGISNIKGNNVGCIM